MRTFIHTFFFIAALLVTVVTNASEPVPYTLAKNYFVKNTYPDKDFHFLKITSEEQFNEIFGAAALMGEGGRPTSIDFKANFVIALINNTTDDVSGLHVHTLTGGNGQLHVTYVVTQMAEPASFRSRYCSILIVNKKYDGKIYAGRADAEGLILVGGDLDEFGCKPSTGYSWSVLKKECISIAQEGGKYLSGPIGNAAFIFGEGTRKVELFGFRYGNQRENLVLTSVPKTQRWTNGSISLTKEKGIYILRDKDKELARTSQ